MDGMQFFGPVGIIVVLAIVILIIGPKQMPKLGKKLGESIKAVRKGVDEMNLEVKSESEPALSLEAAPAGTATVTCPACGTACATGTKFCTSCGADLASVTPLTCPACGTVHAAGMKFCPGCGQKI